MDLLTLLAGLFLVTLVLGQLLEKIDVPWIFFPMLLGIAMAAWNPFEEITSSKSFQFLGHMGIYFLIFLIGYEIETKQIKQSSKVLLRTAAFIAICEAAAGSIHIIFGTDWIPAILVGTSFATVGEALLLPILEKFKILKSKLGQGIIGIGIIDNLVEIAAFVFLSVYLNYKSAQSATQASGFLFWIKAAIPFLLILIVYLAYKKRDKLTGFKIKDHNYFYLAVFTLTFALAAGADYAHAAILGALAAGYIVQFITPEKMEENVSDMVHMLAYALFGPIFFLWVGLDVKFQALWQYIWLIFAIIVIPRLLKSAVLT
jgi:Ca2+-transporting ATPase